VPSHENQFKNLRSRIVESLESSSYADSQFVVTVDDMHTAVSKFKPDNVMVEPAYCHIML
jgi:hypothetical protein